MTYAGLDIDQFPGISALGAVARETNIAWVGYYLPAPSHSNAGWTGNRLAILNLGLAVVPIYVGQQTQGPGSHTVTAIQGYADGQDCVERMVSEGFPSGSFVYLDLENGAPYVKPQSDYVAGWVNQVAAKGFGAGVYCSHSMAADVVAANPTVRVWAFKIPTTDRTIEAGPTFPTPDPSGSGFSAATIWQREQNVQISGPGYSLVVDLSASTLRDPSGPTSTVATPAVSVQPSAPAAPPESSPTSIPPTAGATAQPIAVAPSVPRQMTDFTPTPIELPSQVVAQLSQLGTHGAMYLLGILGTAGVTLLPGDEAKIAAVGGSLAVAVATIAVNAALQYYRHQKAVQVVAIAKAS